jgi:tRNA(Ile)-lysidine synthase
MATRPAKVLIDWPAAADRLAAQIPRQRLHPQVLALAEAMSPRSAWGVGFSGGPDSLALLLLLWAHWPSRRRQLRALHYDHRMRGAESKADAVFCRQVCSSLGIQFKSGHWTGRHRAASESEARRARMTFFTAQARVMWFGHQQDDVAETMLMRLARGSGTGGLAAPRPIQPMPGTRVHLRPLLGIKKRDIVAALKSAGIAWREDSSNARGDYFRNRIRHEVLPVWTQVAQRDAVGGAALSRQLLEEDDTALAQWLDELPMRAPRQGLAIAALAGKPRALARRALHRWLLECRKKNDLSRQAFDALLASVERGKPIRHSLGREGFAVIRGGVLRFEKGREIRRKIRRSAN